MVDEGTLTKTQDRLGHRFADPDLLAAALTHASIADSRVNSNERLEFLGDAVLGVIVCEELYRAYPDLLEGAMTKIKSAVVSRQTCAEIARGLGLDDLLRIGKGMQTQEELPTSLPAAALEAILGAVFLDAGLDAVRGIILPHLRPIIEQVERSGHQLNFKSALQQHAQQTAEDAPVYILLDEQGPDHAKCFEVCVQMGPQRFESAWGRSKKQAEQRAALNALRALDLIERVDGEEIVVAPEDVGSHENETGENEAEAAADPTG